MNVIQKPRWKHLLFYVTLSLFGLTACSSLERLHHPPLETKGYPSPIPFKISGLPANPSKLQVEAYQAELLKYIRYLEQYYITLGVYYGTKTTLNRSTPKDERELQCRAIEGIFKDIPLPKPPITDDRYINETINKLIDHITVLRQRIRENNGYMAQLRDRYRGCK